MARTLGYVLITTDPTPQLRSNLLVDRDFAETHAATGMHIVEISVPDDVPTIPADANPTLLVVERPFTDQDDSQRWIAAVMAAAAPVTAAWAFTARAAEEVAAVARAILGDDT